MSLGMTVATATTSVQNVKVQQRYPWNGLVDIDYEIVSDSPDTTDFYVYFTVKDNDLNVSLSPRTITGDGAVDMAVKKGTHRVTWNMQADAPTLHSSALSATVYASTAIPYMVIDLSGGPDATSYPVRYSATPPDLNDDTCRTTELWLRFIQPGTFMMGSPTNEVGRTNPVVSVSTALDETLHQVTLTQPYYMGVFEVTQKQWMLVTGTNPSAYAGDTRPVDGASYNTIRGTVNGAAWPNNGQVDATSFMGILRAKTSVALDLPTEAQWEYSCRAGTSTALNNGKNLIVATTDANMSLVGRYDGDTSDGKGGYSQHTKVGSYQPNMWGLYDMHGNLWEWCLDSYAVYSAGPAIDPLGATSGNRIIRGGSFGDDASACRSACRYAGNPNSQYIDIAVGYGDKILRIGLRVVALPAIQ